MFIVCAKSAAALVLGGAMMGQQADVNTQAGSQTAAPPAPTVATPRAQAQAQVQAEGATRQVPNQAQPNANQSQRQTYQAQDQSSSQDPSRGNSQQLDQQGRAALGVSVSDDLRITQVSPGSPAEQMGLRAGDEILSLNGQTFDTTDAFIDVVGATPQGQQIQIEFDRNGQRMTQSGQLATWDRVHYSGTNMAGQHSAGYAQSSSQGMQTHSAMRYGDGSFVQGAAYEGQFGGDACCDPCAGGGFMDGGYGSGYAGAGWGYGGYGGGYGYGWDGYGSRQARRAARRGYGW